MGYARSLLDNWGRGTTYTSLVLYMGIPIKGLCEIVSADGAQLTILVEKKQLIATSPGTKWLITPKKGVFISGYVTKNDLYHNFVTLDKLRIIEKGFSHRMVIRYDAEDGDRMMISMHGKKREIPIRDISEMGIAVRSDDDALLAYLSVPNVIRARVMLGKTEFDIDAQWLYTAPIDERAMKVVFKITYDATSADLLKDWMTLKQLHLIKKIRDFVNTLPSVEADEVHGWVI